MELWQMALIVCPLVFIAGFIDSIAGGGGLISMPAYLLTGLPIHVCYGTNKVSACLGTAMAASRFYKNGFVQMKTAACSAAFALVGSFAGARVALLLDATVLKIFFIGVLPFIALFVLFFGKGKRRKAQLQGSALFVTCGAIGLFLGLYDGLIGPGTGTLMIFGYTTFVGYEYVTASGNAKVVNLASNVASALAYVLAGKVLYLLALPAAICSIAGSYFGSGMAIKKGDKFVKGLLVVMLLCIFAKLLYDMLI